ncbi:hypothetical protein PSTG_19401 [Puccinia striiformis f. sp. tritici PST-78]|uniref:Uncharacterized protein n=1 Tax=Puccinia striiformis f. sp. tritici PST-78 TaxID=1165861 RepID=A0A0L0UJK6_9BASI|nr:hypothetical protein PSTG_19401 [Puccinia striiformis f. sp. tritici PST-78]
MPNYDSLISTISKFVSFFGWDVNVSFRSKHSESIKTRNLVEHYLKVRFISTGLFWDPIQDMVSPYEGETPKASWQPTVIEYSAAHISNGPVETLYDSILIMVIGKRAFGHDSFRGEKIGENLISEFSAIVAPENSNFRSSLILQYVDCRD